MKLSVSYNVFDGLELLEPSIANIRPCVEHISIIYQSVSNYLLPNRSDIHQFINNLVSKYSLDYVYNYSPVFSRPVTIRDIKAKDCHQNEFNKRSLGYTQACVADCTHYLMMDVDEFYHRDQFMNCRERINENEWDCTACQIQDYHSKVTYQVRGIAAYYVPFIQSINVQPELNASFFVYTDPTRRTTGYTNPMLFLQDEILMHHMTNCRKDRASYLSKFNNSSARCNFTDIEATIESILNYRQGIGHPETILVNDEFNISSYCPSLI